MNKKISAFFSEKSLSTQVMFIIGVVIAVITAIMMVISHFFINRYAEMLNTQLSTILDVYSDEVQTAVQDIEAKTISFMTDENVQEKIKEFGKNDTYVYEDYVAVNELKKHLLNAVNEKQAIKYAVLLDENYKSFVTALGYNMSWTDEMSSAVREGIDENERCKWLAPSETINDLTVVRRIIDISDPGLPQIAVLVMGINLNELVKAGNINLKDYRFNSIIMSGNDVIYSDLGAADETSSFMEKLEHNGRGRFETVFNGSAYYCTYKEMQSPGWKYAVYVPHNDIMGRLERIVLLGYILLAMFICMVFVLSYKLTKSIVHPLSDLSVQMKKVENGVFEGVVPDKQSGSLEINSIADDFNVMVERIAALINDNYLKKILLQESELKLLQSQINPHFLYNTLESINWMSKTGRTAEISVMVQSLSNLFRSTVNNKEFMVTIKRELELLDNYIAIQKIRFEDKLEVYIDIDDDYYGCMIPKLVLQPLVENAIKYSRESSGGVCVISIYSERKGGIVKICVEDNGPGIDEEQLRRIKNNEQLNSRSGIALKNIRRRMELAYKTENGMEIISHEGAGTIIALNIPISEQ